MKCKKALISLLFTIISFPVFASVAYLQREVIVHPAPQAPFEDIVFAEGHFHLWASNGVFRSADGLHWKWAPSDTLSQVTKVGDLWFRVVDEGGPFDGIYASPDGTNWRKTNALRSPQQFGDGVYASIFSQRVADLSLGNPLHFGFSTDGFQWNLIEAGRGGGLEPSSHFHGRIASLWLTSTGGTTGHHTQSIPEFRVSPDGLSWTTLPWPGADADLDLGHGIFFGEGHLFVLRRVQAGEGEPQLMGFHTENLVDWNVAPVSWPDDLPIAAALQGRILRSGDSIVLRSSWTSYPHPRAPSTHHFADLQTSDFLQFEVTQEASSEGLDISESVGRQAVNPGNGVEVEIVLQDNATALLRREDGSEIIAAFEDALPANSFLNSLARLGDRLYLAGGRSVFFSDDNGTSWELSKDLPFGGIAFEPPGARMPKITGIFSLVASQDSVWFATRRQTFDGDRLRDDGEIWRKSAVEGTWTLMRELPGASLQFFAVEGANLILTGTRDGTAFIEWSMDGEIWETHQFVEPMAQLRVRFAEGKYWLAGASTDGQQGWVLSSGDLREWETVETTNNGSFSDVALVNGTLVLAARNFSTVDYPTQYFVTLPDGSILDNRGRHTSDGFTWTTVEGFDFNQNTRLTVLGDTLYQINFTTRAVSPTSYFSQFDFSLMERSTLVYGEDVPRRHLFAADEETNIDGRVLTEWGQFQRIAPGWFNHERLGIVHAPTNTNGSYWYWLYECGTWVWLHPDVYPFFYVEKEADWAYLGDEVPGWRHTHAENLWRHEPLHYGRTFALPPAPAHPLLYVPAGTFLMGSQFDDWQAHPDEYPAHLVQIEEGFWFAAFETTQAEFARVMGYNPAPPEHRGAQFPALFVTLAEAMEYCQRLTGEGHAAGWLPETHAVLLPTEAQWEYAARAGVWAETLTPYAQMTLWRFLPDYGHFGGFDPVRWNEPSLPVATGPLSVGSLLPAREDFPVQDTHGNVWEWCRNPFYLYDVDTDYPADAVMADQEGVSSARGGGWRSYDGELRLTNRLALEPNTRRDDLGFRIIIERVD